MSGYSLRTTNVTDTAMLEWELLKDILPIKMMCIVYQLSIRIVRSNIPVKAHSGGSENMPNITVFDPRAHHIRLVGAMNTRSGSEYEFRAILDTGAPNTEFSDQFLSVVGLIKDDESKPSIKHGLQTQKYGRLVLPQVKICGHPIQEMQVYVSHYEKHWGVDALIGLDFFRQFRVTIDYKAGHMITEPFIA